MALSKQSKKSWLPVCVACSLLIASFLIAWASYYFNLQMHATYTENEVRLNMLIQRYNAIEDTKQQVVDFLPRFKELSAQGIVGAGNRPNWISALNNATENIKIHNLTYKIAAVKKFTPGFKIDTGRFEIFSSTMQLQMELLHEGDLRALFTELEHNADGIFSISECTLLRSTEVLEIAPNTANLKGTCLLEWLSINLPDGKELVL